jgi:hypothetical protein
MSKTVNVLNSVAKSFTAIGGEAPTNGAAESIESGQPYMASVKIKGTADILFHRWNCEAVEEKAKAAKGSKAKKSDDIESYVWRNHDGLICLPGEYLRQSIIMAAKFRQDPRSPRKSAFDLFKAAIVCLTDLAPIGGKKDWDYIDRRRVQVQRNGITRHRPAMLSGWEAEIQFLVTLPEYVTPAILHDVAVNAGRLCGVGDFRPTYGRFAVTSFDVGFSE